MLTNKQTQEVALLIAFGIKHRYGYFGSAVT
jgi:hypothetical protein